jgi:Kef-type K+ transport system membrane component KefB
VVGSIISAADRGSSLSLGAATLVLAKALVFLLGAFAIGAVASNRVFRIAARLPGRGTLLTTALAFCFLLAALASVVGLAPIVGAYAAGLILEEAHFTDFAERGEQRLEALVRPIAVFLVPVFFVVMGIRVDLGVILQPDALGLAALLTSWRSLGSRCARSVASVPPPIRRRSVSG